MSGASRHLPVLGWIPEGNGDGVVMCRAY